MTLPLGDRGCPAPSSVTVAHQEPLRLVNLYIICC